ncbi:T9SS C-terminal target domain-containing protein [Aquimarina sp. AD10]|uniref:beta-1,3-glucanase family protein n=1 Tax=Aquimarina sp. AD10 TaxID=1714849 RepID=UPI000E51DEF3|nr:beta-1,3-glucanase family protein [Aquimarina sp. AD10]AXT62687.1 T9SS C-terminal target domain-containing protein [Aquimarina sp. AD10]RKN01870.1 carbohydrate-binding protein [Aquimarina sp. AD10]
MKTNYNTINKNTIIIVLIGLLISFGTVLQAQTLPYEIINNSEYSDDELYVAIVGITDGHVWVDAATGQVNRMDRSDNTVQGPVIDGNQGPGENGKYANCFRRLSDIPNKTVQIPKIAGCRIMISFKDQLYLYFFGHSGAPSGYSAPNLANPTDPNQGIKFELIELTYNDIGLWCNTSRVDSYQYPMGLEVWGDNFYKKVGELKKHNDILNQWQESAPSDFKSLLNPSESIIHFPTKVETFPKNFMDGYINDIWSKYSNQELAFTSDAGIWRGKVEGGNRFVFRRDSDGQIGTISGKPTTIEAMEGSGVMASGQRWDLVVQSQMVAAITRHAVDLNVPSGVLQDFGDTSKYYQTWPYNWYSKFFHQTDISFESQTYTFAYDDVYNQSATIHTPKPENIKITIGGLIGSTDPNPPTGVATIYQDCSYGGYAVGLGEGRYTRSQLLALGVRDDDISSVKVQVGYQAILCFDDNFTGTSIVKTGDTNCLVADGFNDQVTSIIISKTSTGGYSQVIEAENYLYMSGVQNENCSEGGQNVGYIDKDDWLVWDINIPVRGSYTVEYRVASPNSTGMIQLEQAGGASVFGTRTVPNTGGWQNWTTVVHVVTLDAGQQEIAIKALTGGWNINWLKVSSSAKMLNEIDANKAKKQEWVIYPNPFTNEISLDFVGKDASITIFDTLGHEIVPATIINRNKPVILSNLSKGVYIVRINIDGKVSTKQLIKTN